MALIQDSFQTRERVSAVVASWQRSEIPAHPKELFKIKLAKLNNEMDELRHKLKSLEDCAESVHKTARDDCLERLEVLLTEMRTVYKDHSDNRDDAISTYKSRLNQILLDSRTKIAAIQEAMPLETSQSTTGRVSPLQDSANESSHETSTTEVTRLCETISWTFGHGSSFIVHIHNEDKIIHFRKLYNNNRLMFASEIIHCPRGSNNFYILFCRDHGLFFQETPLQASRMHAVQHGERRYCSREALVELFGVRIIGCTEKQVKEYNGVIRVYLRSKSHNLVKRSKNLSPRQISSGSRNNHRRHITRPEVGGIYAVLLPTLRTSFAAMVLPYGHFGCVGLPHDIVESGLLYNSRRDSHDFNVWTGDYMWKQGYENDGAREMLREYPVILFDTDNFPSGCSFCWASAEQMQELDLLSDLTIPHRDTVLEFVHHRVASGYDAETVAKGALSF